jgi:colanic acid/amylovoran biosynthesis glycosyltransferase
MKLAYLLNSYPMISTTFIRTEIEELESLGQPVLRLAVRHWKVPLVDPDDLAEQNRTEYLLTGNKFRLLVSAALEPIRNFRLLRRTLPLAWHLYSQSRGGVVRHTSYVLQAIYLKNRAIELGIEHIHAHFSTNSTTVAMLAEALGGPSFSFTVHGPDELVEPWHNSLRMKVLRSAFVVAITDYCRAQIERESPGHEHKIRVIRCGIKLPKFVPVAAGGRAGRFVCVGRLCANKAQSIIPAAVAMVKREFPQVRIDLIGDGEERAHIEKEVRLHGVGDNVHLAGWASAETVRQLISKSACLLLPSLAEGLPIVIMEAMALERPVLTTPIAGIPELVDDGCGWVFPAGSIEALANALRASLRASPNDLQKKGAEGRRRVEDRHDVNHSAKCLLQGFLSVCVGAQNGASP